MHIEYDWQSLYYRKLHLATTRVNYNCYYKHQSSENSDFYVLYVLVFHLISSISVSTDQLTPSNLIKMSQQFNDYQLLTVSHSPFVFLGFGSFGAAIIRRFDDHSSYPFGLESKVSHRPYKGLLPITFHSSHSIRLLCTYESNYRMQQPRNVLAHANVIITWKWCCIDAVVYKIMCQVSWCNCTMKNIIHSNANALISCYKVEFVRVIAESEEVLQKWVHSYCSSATHYVQLFPVYATTQRFNDALNNILFHGTIGADHQLSSCSIHTILMQPS